MNGNKDNFEEELSGESVSAQDFKCPVCGASLEFNPATQKFICAYCRTEQSFVISHEVNERDFAEILQGEKWKSAKVKAVRCENCGATEVFEEKAVAKSCPFCGSPKVLGLESFEGLRPNVVIPFKINASDAMKICLKWLKKRLFAPSGFKKEAAIDNINGIYYPAWTFDSDVNVNYSGRLGKNVTVTYTDSEGHQHTREETEWFYVRGAIGRFFDDILINAGKSIEERWFNGLKPFSQSEYVKYENSFLAGFSASTYALEPLDAWKIAEARIKEVMKNDIMRKHNADVVGSLDMDVHYAGKSFKYMLVPIYVTAAYYKNKLYNQYVNGTHGKVCGRAPVSPVRVSAAVFAGLSALALIIFLLSHFQVF